MYLEPRLAAELGHDGLVAFGEGRMNHSTWQYGFWTRTAFLPVRDLVGCMVNLGDKGGAVYERVTVAATDGDRLVLENGRMSWPWQPDRPAKLRDRQAGRPP